MAAAKNESLDVPVAVRVAPKNEQDRLGALAALRFGYFGHLRNIRPARVGWGKGVKMPFAEVKRLRFPELVKPPLKTAHPTAEPGSLLNPD